MANRSVAVILGTLIALPPLDAIAQSAAPDRLEQVAQADSAIGTAHAAGGGSHRRHLRHRSNQSRERARAGAEHMRQMRQAPAPN